MLHKYPVILSLALVLVAVCSCKKQDSIDYQIQKTFIADNAVVVSAHPLASKIGLEILKKGGNAVDASIAVQFALAVCYPQAGNIGGGGFMIYRDATGNSFTLDYREKAPSAASTDMYLDENGNVIPNLSLKGHLAAGVPGSVAGMYEAFNKYSRLKNWKALVQPAIELAMNGFQITKREARNLNENALVFKEVNDIPTPFTAKENWKAGDVLIQKDLASTLEIIRDQGADGFYTGRVAEQIAMDQQKNGGIISLSDLKEYKPEWRPVIKFNYRGYTVHTMGPPSSGGIILCQLLKSIEPYRINSLGFHTPESIHLMVEAERRAYADRATHLGDMDYYNVPVSRLMDSIYIAGRMAGFNPNKASVSDSIFAGNLPTESEQTTHLSIVDQYGNAVSVTTTLNGSYGSHAVVEGAGFILNNEMDDFSSKPGVPNLYGLIGAEANKIEPGKRMLSAMTPSILDKDGMLQMVVGTPGGSTIITSIFQMIVNMVDHDMSASKAVQASRFHHQWKPDEIEVEDDCLTPDVKSRLEKMGHLLKSRGKIGRVEAIKRLSDGKWEGAADTRGDDDAEGY